MNETINEYLEHHGIKGQSWGQKNGPPYPLSSRIHAMVTRKSKSDKSEKKSETKEERHARLVKSTNAKELYKYRKELSDKEIQSRLERINNEKRLKEYAEADKKKFENDLKKIINAAKTASDFYTLYHSDKGKSIREYINLAWSKTNNSGNNKKGKKK